MGLSYSGKEVIAKLRILGYEVIRQKGSHVRLKNPENPNLPNLTVPNHAEISIGVLGKILRDIGMTAEKFRKL